MNRREYEELKIGDLVQICNGKNKGGFATINKIGIHEISTATGALVEIVSGEYKRYHYKALRISQK